MWRWWPWPQQAALYACCERAVATTRRWSETRGLPLHRIETVAAFERWSRDLGVWVFYETDSQRARANSDGSSTELQRTLLCALRDEGYPRRWLAKVSVVFDSHETVLREYDGRYFLRLR